MIIDEDDERHNIRRFSDFDFYLRTGLRRVWHASEKKFNPWHDPENGQFTFAGTGEYHMGRPPKGGFGGYVGGGRGMDGGGASGSWEPDKSKPKKPTTRKEVPRTAQPKKPARVHGRFEVVSPSAEALEAEARAERQLQEGRHFSSSAGSTPASKPTLTQPQLLTIKNGYRFKLDEQQRTRKVDGKLNLTSKIERSRTNQSRAGGEDRRQTDEGGHYVAARFNGPKDAFNHFAQDAKFNRSEYRSLENEWARNIARGKKVLVEIVPSYDGASKRPKSIKVTWNMDGKKDQKVFINASKGSSYE